MKEKIYTIPVNDAFGRNDRDCPLCVLGEKLEGELLDYYLGPSLMESDVRETTNQQGFCRHHAHALFARERNRLGLGLMYHTRIHHVRDVLTAALAKAGEPARKSLRGRSKDPRDRLRDAARQVRAQAEGCVVCDRLARTMARYLDVICWQYAREPAFRPIFADTHHFCVPHLADLLEAAATHLRPHDAAAMLSDLQAITRRALDDLEHDVEWFTLKFDYRNQDKPWGNSKDAVIRAIRALTGGAGPGLQEKDG